MEATMRHLGMGGRRNVKDWTGGVSPRPFFLPTPNCICTPDPRVCKAKRLGWTPMPSEH
jgi:hypothetical protein